MPSALISDADLRLTTSPDRPDLSRWVSPDGTLRLEGHPVVLTELARRWLLGERIMVSCSGRGVAPLRRKNPDPDNRWRRDADYRVVRWLSAPREDVLVLREEIKDWTCKDSVCVLDEHDEPFFNFSPSWRP